MKIIKKLLLATTIFLASTTALADETIVVITENYIIVCNVTTGVCIVQLR